MGTKEKLKTETLHDSATIQKQWLRIISQCVQPLPANPKSSSVQKKRTAQTCKETRQPPARRCPLPSARARESCRHLAFSPFSTLVLPGWEPGRVLGLHTSLPGIPHSLSPSTLTAVKGFLLLHFLTQPLLVLFPSAPLLHTYTGVTQRLQNENSFSSLWWYADKPASHSSASLS